MFLCLKFDLHQPGNSYAFFDLIEEVFSSPLSLFGRMMCGAAGEDIAGTAGTAGTAPMAGRDPSGVGPALTSRARRQRPPWSLRQNR